MAGERVLVLDAHLRHALGLVRSLGRHGVPVVCASHLARFPARHSRYAETSVMLDPGAAGAQAELLRVARDTGCGVVVAAGLPGNELLCRHRDELAPHIRGPYNDVATFNCLADKHATGMLADRLGVRRPVSRQASTARQAPEIAEELGFPLVFKSPVDQGTVRYPADVEELAALIAAFGHEHPELVAQGSFPLVQQYIEGDGHGFYGLSEHGRLRAYFMHRRLHEVPPSGGPSAMAMSFRDQTLLDLGTRFLAETAWHGVAMVEFKRSLRDGEYYLIEVNPKFWGSLDLSIAAGVDFPWLLYALLTGSPMDVRPGEYMDGVIFRWLTMDLAYAVASRNLRGYVRAFFDARVRDDFVPSDPLPTASLFLNGALRMAGATSTGSAAPPAPVPSASQE